MSLGKTPRANRVHIGIFGRRNAGKSSLINAITGQDIALVSSAPGTTTDPVYKAMELYGAGPVVFIDTPGIDDIGDLGKARAKRALQVLRKTDIAVIVVDPIPGFGLAEKNLLNQLMSKSMPVIAVVGKQDIWTDKTCLEKVAGQVKAVYRDFPASGGKRIPEPWACGVSSATGQGISELTTRLCETIENELGDTEPAIIGDLLEPGDLVFLVVPLDLQAPKGRLILPQVQTIRDLLDHGCVAVLAKTFDLPGALENSKQPPKLVITDSQVFQEVDSILPAEILLTSFSILFARYKGDLHVLAEGARALGELKPHDKVLVAEACTHHPIEDDIGTVKIPRWLESKVGGPLEFSWQRGIDYPENLEEFKVIVHCGGCMLNRREMQSRIDTAKTAGVPITNYGMTIAYTKGILERALKPFGLGVKSIQAKRSIS
ncbi:MAG: [FeFe] hydrogenase H-cluster maturation GTPase HydF [Bacillota bacterium]|jgi:[FeFe] hydrogenase H-cluster maturation GTPase HydF